MTTEVASRKPGTAKNVLARLRSRTTIVIPTRLKSDTRPLSGADGADAFWVVDQEGPGILAGVDDGLIAVPDQGTELVAAQVLPDVLHRVQLRRIGRQWQQRDVVG